MLDFLAQLSLSVSQTQNWVSQFFTIPWTMAHQASLSISSHWSLLKCVFIETMMPSNHLIFCHLLLLLPSFSPSIRDFSNESVLHNRWPKYWSFSLRISRSNEYSGLISLGIDWLDLLSVQGTLKSLLQHNNLRASILWCSAFFIVQHMHFYMTTGEIIALTRQTIVGNVISLLYTMRSRFGIAFHPRTKHLLITWMYHLQWFWSLRKWRMSLFPLFTHLFAIKWWNQMSWFYTLYFHFKQEDL